MTELTDQDNLTLKVQNLTNEVNTLYELYPDDYPLKSSILSQKLEEVLYFVKELKNQNLQLKEHIKAVANNDEYIIDRNDMPNKINSISSDTLIIYIKNAQLYRMYKPEDLDDFRNHEGTIYKHRDTGPVYEVARDTCPQKLMIVLTDDEDIRLEIMKTYIMDFLKNYPKLSATINDLIIYKNGSNIEILINNTFLDNLADKERFVENFMRFLHQRGESEMANKIQVRPPVCELPDTRFYLLPSIRQQIDGPIIHNSLNHLITTAITNGVPSVNININVQNIDNSVTNNDNSVNTTIIGNSTKKTIKSFCKHIYDTKPDWYTPDALVDVKIIEDAFRDYFVDSESTASSISRLLKGKLFNTGSRIKGITMKKLFSMALLKKNT